MHVKAMIVAATVMPIVVAAMPAAGQLQLLATDRDLDAAIRIDDANGSGVIDAGEVTTYFSAANVAGTLGPLNPTCLGVSICRVAGMGDQGHRVVYRLSDENQDGDAQDVGESIVFADATNAGQISFAFPTGVAFDSQCRMHVANAGNSFGLDGLYRLVDLNGDGDAQDQVNGAFEATEFVGQPLMGSVNSTVWGPQEIFFDPDDVCFMRNSVTGNFAVWRFEDINDNGRADDAGESTMFFGQGNASGITLSAGLPMGPDRRTPGAVLMVQIAAGGLDQIVRLVDANNDADAQDAGEAVIVWSEVIAAISVVDLSSLPSGDILMSEGGSGRIHLLRDLTADGDFMDPGEMTVYHDNLAGALLDVRHLDLLRRSGDSDSDGVVNVDDLLEVVNHWGGSGCQPADIDCSGTVDVNDLLAVINFWS